MDTIIDKVLYLNYEGRWGGYRQATDVPHHLLMFMDKGACSYLIDGKKYTVKKGEVLFMAAGAPRQGEAANDESHAKYSIHWTGEGMFEHFPGLREPAVWFRSSSMYDYLKQMYSRMYQLWSKKDMYYGTLCQSMLLEVAVRLHQETASSQLPGKQAIAMMKVRDYIKEYYREPLSIDELAHHVQRNASHLITSFRKTYGVAPLEYMHRTRIAKAEELLLTTDAKIEDIAAELGYCDAAYFNRMFKRISGMTPSAFRRLL